MKDERKEFLEYEINRLSKLISETEEGTPKYISLLNSLDTLYRIESTYRRRKIVLKDLIGPTANITCTIVGKVLFKQLKR